MMKNILVAILVLCSVYSSAQTTSNKDLEKEITETYTWINKALEALSYTDNTIQVKQKFIELRKTTLSGFGVIGMYQEKKQETETKYIFIVDLDDISSFDFITDKTNKNITHLVFNTLKEGAPFIYMVEDELRSKDHLRFKLAIKKEDQERLTRALNNMLAANKQYIQQTQKF